ncbi:Hypothetical protein D9617_26g078690 [Elsinoe fawcettii]|nr:Hypothetical protein D9617_26g078690 [Elsinoe fawcettii]
MLLYFSLAVFLSVADAVCYKPTGAAQVADFVPCNSFNASNSYCCGAGRAEGLPDDVCMPNGLCSQYTVNETNVDTMLYWREGCSNPDWPDEVCLRNVCPDPSQNDSNGNARITPCDGTPSSRTWCCGENRDCCGKGGADEIVLQATLGAVQSSSRTSTTSSPASSPSVSQTSTTSDVNTATSVGVFTQPTASQTGAGNPTNTPSPTATAAAESSGLSTGAVAGIGVGAGAAGVALIGAIVLLCLRRRRNSRSGGRSYKHDSVSPSESASQHPLGPSSGVGYVSNPVSQVAYAHHAQGAPPPPPTLFSPTEPARSPQGGFPYSGHTTVVYPKYEAQSPTAELDVDRPIRELPADSAVGYVKA